MTNYKRSKWDDDVSPLCSFCNVNFETTIHIFVLCAQVKKLWASLGRWLIYMSQIEVNSTPDIIIYNNYKDVHQGMINAIILIVKQYVYATKCEKEELNFRNMLSKIYECERIESRIAKKNNKYSKHYQKWFIIIVN